jgi:cystathionine beta-lyase/cystathionine gamma-synthase
LFPILARFGIEVESADLLDPDVGARVLGPAGTDVAQVWIETPSKPLLKITDLPALYRLTHERGALVVVDNTLASPALQQPLRWAAVSLDGVQSLIECPASMTHAAVSVETRRRRGIADNLVRVSIGIEDPDDLVVDLTDAMRAD